MSLRAVIFDFDGVIGNTYQLNYQLAQSFHQGLSEQDFKNHHNGNVYEKPKINFKDGDGEVFFAKQKELFTKENLFPLSEVLRQLTVYQLFIVSSSSNDNLHSFLKMGQLNDLFEKVLGMDTHRSKVVKFQMLFKTYDLQPEECLFVTDTTGDIIEAREVGVRTIAVSWGYHDVDTLAGQHPWRIVKSPEELLGAISAADRPPHQPH